MSEHNKNNNNTRRADAAPAPTETPEYKVGPGRPPKEYRFKPGQSGNPKGAKRKPKPIAPDLKAALEQALNNQIKVKQGEKERIVSMAVAGIEQLVAQFVKGNHQARRDLIALADKLGVDLMGQQQTLQEAVTAKTGSSRLHHRLIGQRSLGRRGSNDRGSLGEQAGRCVCDPSGLPPISQYFRPSSGALWPTRWRGNDVLLTSSTPKMRALLEAARRSLATVRGLATARKGHST